MSYCLQHHVDHLSDTSYRGRVISACYGLDQYVKLSVRCDFAVKLTSIDRRFTNQSLLLYTNDACLIDHNKYQFYSLWFTPTGD